MKICIDAGHTGKTNPYTVNGKTISWESEMAWKLHNLLAEKLEAEGVEVLRTRSLISEDPALEDRGKTAAGCDLFLSLHSNAADNQTTDYPLGCCCVAGTADDIGLKLAQTVASVMGTTQAARIWKRDYYQTGGAMLLSASDPSFGKAAYNKDYYGVLRGAASVGVPGVLLECSFHTNPSRAQWLTVDANLDALAGALCSTIAGHYGLAETKSEWAIRYDALKADYDSLIAGLKSLLERYMKG